MPSSRPNGRRRVERQRVRAARRARRVALLVVLSAVFLVALGLTAFGASTTPTAAVVPRQSQATVAQTRPTTEIVAVRSSLHLQLPISQSRLTAIGYHSAAGALPLNPIGHQANEGLVQRVVHGIFGGGGGSPKWYSLGGGDTSALDVGAPIGSDVYSPVDGTVVAIRPFVVEGRTYGSEIDIQPQTAPSVVVALTQLVSDPALTVGAPGRLRRDEARPRGRPRRRRAAGARALHERRRQPRDGRGPVGARHSPPARDVKILFLADVFGVPGRRAVEEHLPALRERYEADLAIVNGENAADGAGITGKLADKLLAAGADVVTLGNHTYRRGGHRRLSRRKRARDPAGERRRRGAGERRGSGRGAERRSVAVLNLLGQLFLPTPVSPWEMVDALVEDARAAAPVVIVDFHAEATSEKIALATWLDGRVTAVLGTHTHVQTNDARILPGGTAASPMRG